MNLPEFKQRNSPMHKESPGKHHMITTTSLFSPIRVMLALALASTVLLTGCRNSPGGDGMSNDTYTYISTPYEPITVTLYDQRDREPLWTVEVPIGQKVTLRFLDNRAKEGTTRRPDIMQWEIYDETKRRANLSNTMAVPPASSRLLKVSIRDGIEYPDEKLAPVEYDDPDREWVPVEPRKFRGVPVENTTRQGSYISDD
jgi:hypothetical protein